MDASLFNSLAGGAVSLNEAQVKYLVAALNDNLKKAQDASTVGYQVAPTIGGPLSPLLPQSIDPVLTSLAISQDELMMWKMLPKDTATQTLHEYRRRVSHGSLVQDHNVGEGSAGNNSTSTYDMQSVQIKFWSVRREITDVAAGLTGIAPASNLLTEHTNEAAFDLLRSVEMDTLFGDTDLISTKVNGVIKQIVAKGKTEDLAGAQITLDRISLTLRKLAQPTSARGGIHPTHILTTHAIWNDLERQERKSGARFDKTTSEPKFYFGAEAINVLGPKGNIPIIAVPFLDDQAIIGLPSDSALSPNGSGVSGSVPAGPVAPDITVNGTGWASGANASSKFLAADAGAYWYKVVAHNADGFSAPTISAPFVGAGNPAGASAAVTVAAGDVVTMKFKEETTSYKPTYYRVYRSPKNGAVADCAYLYSVKVPAGAGNIVTISDTNSVRANTGRVLFWTNDKDHVCFYRLLPMARIPLAKIQLTTPFSIFMSGAPVIKLPEKFYMMTNVGFAAAL
jgi:hypothetical protein